MWGVYECKCIIYSSEWASSASWFLSISNKMNIIKRPLQNPVTWYGINYAGTQATYWDFQNKGKSGWTGTSSFVLEVPKCNLSSSMIIYSVLCDRIMQRASLQNRRNFLRISGEQRRKRGERVASAKRELRARGGSLKKILASKGPSAEHTLFKIHQ